MPSKFSFVPWTFRIVVILLSFVTICYLLDIAERHHQRALSKPYRLLSISDSNTNERTHKVAYITADAATADERAYTTLRAALDLQAKTGAAVISVLLSPNASFANHGLAVAIADYAPDGMGLADGRWTWQIEVSQGQLDLETVAVVSEWLDSVSQFNDEAYATDFVAQKFGISSAQVLRYVDWTSEIVRNRRPYPLSAVSYER